MSEALKRKLADALAAYQRDEIDALGPAYRFHAILLRFARKRKDQAESAVAGELIQVLAKLEESERPSAGR